MTSPSSCRRLLHIKALTARGFPGNGSTGLSLTAMFIVKTPSVFFLLACIVSYAICDPLQETNSQRMARGLPPSPPRFGRILPGNVQARNDPTPTFGMHRYISDYLRFLSKHSPQLLNASKPHQHHQHGKCLLKPTARPLTPNLLQVILDASRFALRMDLILDMSGIGTLGSC